MSQFQKYIESPKGSRALRIVVKGASLLGAFIVGRAVTGGNRPTQPRTILVTTNHYHTEAPITDEFIPGLAPSVDSLEAQKAKLAEKKASATKKHPATKK